MASSGPLSPTTAATSGSPAWTASSGLLADALDASDDIRATCGIAASGVSGTLAASGYGFAIPGGSTIDGITVAVERRSTTGNVITGSSLRLMKSGVAVGDNKADAVTKWPLNTDSVATYGGAADLWGTTWSVSEINDAGFGVAMVAANTDAGATRSAQVDTITITVNYTAGSVSGAARMTLTGVG